MRPPNLWNVLMKLWGGIVMAEQYEKVTEIDNFIFLREWLDSISNLDITIQDKIIGEIVRYGTNADMVHEDD